VARLYAPYLYPPIEKTLSGAEYYTFETSIGAAVVFGATCTWAVGYAVCSAAAQSVEKMVRRE